MAAVTTQQLPADPDPDDLDLNCKERVEDSDSASESDDDGLIENKAFPQQRFSPVMKTIGGGDVTHRPKPIKMRPGADLIPVPAPDPPTGLPTFQPKGAVFRAARPKPEPLVLAPYDVEPSRMNSMKNDTVVQLLQRNEMHKLGGGGAAAVAASRILQRSNSMNSVSSGPTTVGQHLMMKAASMVSERREIGKEAGGEEGWGRAGVK